MVRKTHHQGQPRYAHTGLGKNALVPCQAPFLNKPQEATPPWYDRFAKRAAGPLRVLVQHSAGMHGQIAHLDAIHGRDFPGLEIVEITCCDMVPEGRFDIFIAGGHGDRVYFECGKRPGYACKVADVDAAVTLLLICDSGQSATGGSGPATITTWMHRNGCKTAVAALDILPDFGASVLVYEIFIELAKHPTYLVPAIDRAFKRVVSGQLRPKTLRRYTSVVQDYIIPLHVEVVCRHVRRALSIPGTLSTLPLSKIVQITGRHRFGASPWISEDEWVGLVSTVNLAKPGHELDVAAATTSKIIQKRWDRLKAATRLPASEARQLRQALALFSTSRRIRGSKLGFMIR